MLNFFQEVVKCCIFVIILYLDVGKIMIMEKVLLFGQVIQKVGMVKGKKLGQYVKFDWMEMEKEWGILVIILVMQFLYGGKLVNLLDILGYEDFFEDIYCILIVVDFCLMVIDSVKGVEDCMIKLMEVICLCDMFILIFMNKLDWDIWDLVELMDEVEDVLKIVCVFIIWFIGMGKSFKGVYYLLWDEVILYQFGQGYIIQDMWIIVGLDNFEFDEVIGVYVVDFWDEIELVKGVFYEFDCEVFLVGELMFVFFGIVLGNFGVDYMLDGLVDWVLQFQFWEMD